MRVNQERKMICPGCDGQIMEVPLFGQAPEILGVCQKCGGAYLLPTRKVLATSWCKCPDVQPEDERYYFTEKAHGWIHNGCGQITQVG